MNAITTSDWTRTSRLLAGATASVHVRDPELPRALAEAAVLIAERGIEVVPAELLDALAARSGEVELGSVLGDVLTDESQPRVARERAFGRLLTLVS